MRSAGTCVLCVALAGAIPAAAQSTESTEPPAWDVQLGTSFVGTSGNSDTSTIGGDFGYHFRGLDWQIEATGKTVRTTDRGVLTAEQYVAGFRSRRTLTDRLGLSTGLRAERDRLSGIALRTILDGGLSWEAFKSPRWTVDTLASLAWNHEQRLVGANRNDPVGTLQLVSKVTFGSSSFTAQRLTIYPDLKQASAYRAEAEVTAESAMNSWLALRIGYLLRYSNSPVPGFGKTDNTTTASVVLHWHAATTAPNR